MARKMSKCPNVKVHCDAYTTALRLLSGTFHADEADERIMEALDALGRIYAEMTGQLCRVTLRLGNPDGSLRTFSRVSDSSEKANRTSFEMRTSSPREIAAIRTLMKPSCYAPYFLFNDLAASSNDGDGETGRANEFNAALMVAVRQPKPSGDRNHDVKGVLSVENQIGGFDDINAKALVAFGYEMYYAIIAFEKSMYSDCLEGLSLK